MDPSHPEDGTRKDAARSEGRSLPVRALVSSVVLALAYVAAGKIPLSTGLAYQAYLFWPAAALAHTAFFILGRQAGFGLLAGALLLNLTSWLPWPQALGMAALQTAGPLLAWQTMTRLGCPHPDLRRLRDLLWWLGVAALADVLGSALLGSFLVGSALPGGFHQPWATALSWFLGDLAALLCLGPALLLVLGPRDSASGPLHPPSRRVPWLQTGLIAGSCLLLLGAGHLNAQLSRDVRLALQFALVLPVLWMALRLGSRLTALGTALLSVGFLGALHLHAASLPAEAFRFSQLYLLVLAFSALVTAAATEETRRTRHALAQRDLQAQRMEAVGSLAGGLVHEFNNELTVLLGHLDRLRERLLDHPEVGGLVDRLEGSAQALEGTVRHLKDLSHQAPVQVTPRSVRGALAPFLATLDRLPDRIVCETDLPEGLAVILDPDLLRQALQALLTNSLEAIPGRGRLRLSARPEGDWLLLAFEDDGPGMPPEVLQRACDPFFSTKPVGAGRGLGLSIAFALTRQMGGEFDLESRPGRGTRVEFRFPLSGPREASQPPAPTPSPSRRILLADDEASIRELTRECLEGEGFQVQEAADGLEALDAFESDLDGWDLVILDLVMPRLHGSEVLRRIHELRPEVPVLLISGYSTEARPDLLQAPHRRFLAKPFRLRELLDVLADLGLSTPPSAPPLGKG